MNYKLLTEFIEKEVDAASDLKAADTSLILFNFPFGFS